VVQAVERLLCKCQALSSNPSPIQKIKHQVLGSQPIRELGLPVPSDGDVDLESEDSQQFNTLAPGLCPVDRWGTQWQAEGNGFPLSGREVPRRRWAVKGVRPGWRG
jgi:hypothetical protein